MYFHHLRIFSVRSLIWKTIIRSADFQRYWYLLHSYVRYVPSIFIPVSIFILMYSREARRVKLTTSTITWWKICDANMYDMFAANIIRRYDGCCKLAASFRLPTTPHKATPASSLSPVVNIRFVRWENEGAVKFQRALSRAESELGCERE